MTVNPMHGARTMNLMIFAVVRYGDRTVVAQHIRNKELTIEGVRECIASNARIAAGKRYTSQGQDQAIHYTLDAQGRVFAIVTNSRYSPRVAFAALDEMQQMFNKELGIKVASALEGTLTQPAKPIFKHIFEKYENPANVDKLVAVNEKIDVVKSVMKDNINDLLQNTEKLEEIEKKSEMLNTQAAEFSKGSKELTTKMWWKKWKMRLLIGGLITSVLILIIVPTAVANSSSSSKK